MLGHYMGLGGAADSSQLPLSTVLEAKRGDVEHAAITVAEGVLVLESLAARAPRTPRRKTWRRPCTSA